eukprot:635336-Pleurochrysis_carterae.AAC.3
MQIDEPRHIRCKSTNFGACQQRIPVARVVGQVEEEREKSDEGDERSDHHRLEEAREVVPRNFHAELALG